MEIVNMSHTHIAKWNSTIFMFIKLIQKESNRKVNTAAVLFAIIVFGMKKQSMCHT